MNAPKNERYMRYEPVSQGVVRRRPITQRNLKSPIVNPGSDDDADTFGTVAVSTTSTTSTNTGESAIVVTRRERRDRPNKGINDGRGRRGMKDMLLSEPTPEGKAVYAMERIAAMEDQIAKMLDLCPEEVREIIFKRRASLKQYWDK